MRPLNKTLDNPTNFENSSIMKYRSLNIWHLSIAVVMLVLGNASLLAQTFPSPGLTLPAGKTICITYEVTVNNGVCPEGTILSNPNISNQSNVSGSNFSTVQTNDPDNPAADPSPTLTPIASLTLGDLVYEDVNRNGVFDAGDAGIDGVLLNLYADDGYGMQFTEFAEQWKRTLKTAASPTRPPPPSPG